MAQLSTPFPRRTSSLSSEQFIGEETGMRRFYTPVPPRTGSVSSEQPVVGEGTTPFHLKVATPSPTRTSSFIIDRYTGNDVIPPVEE